MQRLIMILTLATALMVTVKATADNPPNQTLRLVSFHIPHFLDSKQQGSFIHLFQRIQQLSNYQLKLSLKPTKRAQFSFENGQADLYFPGLDSSIKSQQLRSDTVFYKEVFAFVRKGEVPPTNLIQLRGQRLGLTSGYNYGNIVSSVKQDAMFAKSDKINFLKLQAGRIDVFLVERYSGLKALEQSEAENILFDPDAPISREPVFFIFAKNPLGYQARETFNRIIGTLKESGELNAILSGSKGKDHRTDSSHF